MTPKAFGALALLAVLSALLAVASYSSSVQWSRATKGGQDLFAAMPDQIDEITEIALVQGDKELTLEREGAYWFMKQHDSYPASPGKVSSLLRALAKAKLVEPKTRQEDRYSRLGVADLDASQSQSLLVRLSDRQGKELGAVIVGDKRFDAFGIGHSGSYVRRLGEEQAWLANAAIDTGPELTDWVDPLLFEARKEDVKRMTVHLPSEEMIEIKRDERGHTLADIPEGMTLKYINIVDEIVRAASTVNFTDVRKAQQVNGSEESTVIIELEGELTATYRIRQEGDAVWLSLSATGKSEAKKVADELNAKAKGWEYQIPESRIEQILRTRDELLEKVSS